MSRTARLPLIVGTVVLIAALVTLIVRVQSDDAGVGTAGDDANGVTAQDPDDPAADEPLEDEPVDDATEDDATEDDATEDDATEDDATEDDAPEDDATEDGIAADDPSAAGTPDDEPQAGEDGDVARTPDAAEGDDRDGDVQATQEAPDASGTEGAASDDEVIAAPAPDPEASRDRVPGVDPLPDTGATPAALGLIALGGLAALRRR